MNKRLLLLAVAIWCVTEISAAKIPDVTDGQICTIRIVESIPDNVTYPDGSVKFPSTYDAWMNLINSAEKSISIASFYWTMLGTSVVNKSIPASQDGENVFSELMKTSVRVEVVNNGIEDKTSELNFIARKENAEVRYINFPSLGLGGILHTKLWLVDGRHAYVGSANMDFRSLTEVKELGLWLTDCPYLVADLQRIYDIYWTLSLPNAKIPDTWPSPYDALTNNTNVILLYQDNSTVFFSNSPPLFNANLRSNDATTLVENIQQASEFVYVAVMDYAPLIVIYNQFGHNTFWPIIDNAIREAAVIRRIRVRLLMSQWQHSPADMKGYLNSLQELSLIPHVKIEVRLFHIPAYTPEQESIPYGRVNHNKYMVTDKSVYIGTSNWSGDYFTNTGGISFTATSKNGTKDDLRAQTEALFLRDWNSDYTFPLKYD